LALCLVLVAMAGRSLVAMAAAQARVVYVIPIDGVIDLGLAPFVERTLKEAATQQASAVVLEIDTFGGRVDAAVLIRDALLRTPIRTIAFVNKRAISAGVLIALATTIAMAEGGHPWGCDPCRDGRTRRPCPTGGRKDRVVHAQGIPRHGRSSQAATAARRGDGRCGCRGARA
jgi:membrane-bound serine protease (ClpP class)